MEIRKDLSINQNIQSHHLMNRGLLFCSLIVATVCITDEIVFDFAVFGSSIDTYGYKFEIPKLSTQASEYYSLVYSDQACTSMNDCPMEFKLKGVKNSDGDDDYQLFTVCNGNFSEVYEVEVHDTIDLSFVFMQSPARSTILVNTSGGLSFTTTCTAFNIDLPQTTSLLLMQTNITSCAELPPSNSLNLTDFVHSREGKTVPCKLQTDCSACTCEEDSSINDSGDSIAFIWDASE